MKPEYPEGTQAEHETPFRKTPVPDLNLGLFATNYATVH